VFDSHLKSTGRDYTRVFAWLAIAIVFIPALFLVFRVTYVSILMAVAASATCFVMALVQWKNSSRLGIPSIASRSLPNPRG